MEATERAQMPAGHWWKEPDRVANYVAQWDREAEQNQQVLSMLASVLPHDRQAPIKVLDIGSGFGVVAAAVLDAYPNATAIGLDISEAMMEEGSERMKRFGNRFRYHVGDFADGTLPAELAGPFDVVVSARAIHHLPAAGKQRLFADIYQHLNPGGCFVEADNTNANDDFTRARYNAANPNYVPRPPRPEGEAPRPASREFPEPIEDQLRYLRQAGFPHVDVFWKHLGRSLFGGFKD